MIELVNHLPPMLTGYLGGVIFSLLLSAFVIRGGQSVTWRFILPMTLLWPLLLPLMVLIPRAKPWKFRA